MHPLSARADATVLIGLTSVDTVRPPFAFSFGYRPSAVGVEVEYLTTKPGDYSAGGSFGSVIVQRLTIAQAHIFVVAGAGVWGAGFEAGKRTRLCSAVTVGGGALLHVTGPLKLRPDYRLFRLGEVSKEEIGAISPSRKHPQRIAAGLSVRF